MAKRVGPTSQTQSFNKDLGLSFAAAIVAETITFPMDSAKVWLQTQRRHAANSTSWYRVGQNLYQTTSKAIRNGGLRSFYQGLPFAVSRCGMSTAAVISLYSPILHACPETWSSTTKKVAASSVVALAINGLLTPLEIIKTRLQSDGRKDVARRRYYSNIHSVWSFYEKNGLRAFWSGGMPTLYRAGVWWATTIPVYDFCKQTFINRLNFADGSHVHFVSSVASGFTATLASHPADVMKTRMQDQSLKQPRYNNSFHCASSIVKKEGIRGLFRGFGPRYARLGPWQVIFWTVYEQLSLLIDGHTF